MNKLFSQRSWFLTPWVGGLEILQHTKGGVEKKSRQRVQTFCAYNQMDNIQ